ncbi:MAG: hypothetical protein JNL54_06490 [Kineosporiaceae bacterium]|nr:hypothetical protein [Kineosporiaceae bacterium]
MSFLFELVVVVHLLGMAAIVGSYLTVLRQPRFVPAMLHGALTQVVTGIVMVGLIESKVVEDEEIDRVKITVKLAIALIVAVLAWMNRKRDDAPSGVVHAIGGLAIVNVLIAALW